MATPTNVTVPELGIQLEMLTTSVNLAWTLIAAYLVFCTVAASSGYLTVASVMIAGFTMLEAGSIRSKNVKNIVLKVRAPLRTPRRS